MLNEHANSTPDWTVNEWQSLEVLAHKLWGFKLADRNISSLQWLLKQLMARHQIDSVQQLFHRVENDRVIHDDLTDLLAVGETYFMRYQEQLDIVIHEVLPQWFESAKPGQQLRIWSAGCSVGAEAYTLAILLKAHFLPQLERHPVLIYGTDISRQALEKAQHQVFRGWELRGTESDWRERWFKKLEGDQYALKSLAPVQFRFSQHNLITDFFPQRDSGLCDFDLVFCRNVLIYFSLEDSEKVIAKLADSLRPQGWFVAGASEPFDLIGKHFSGRHSGHNIFRQSIAPDPPVNWFNQSSPSPDLSTLSELPNRLDLTRLSESLVPSVLPCREIELNARLTLQNVPSIDERPSKKGRQQTSQQVNPYKKTLPEAEIISIEELIQFGLQAELDGDLESAKKAFRGSLYLAPQSIIARYHCARLSYRQFKPLSAEKQLHQLYCQLAAMDDNEIIPMSEGLKVHTLQDTVAQLITAEICYGH